MKSYIHFLKNINADSERQDVWQDYQGFCDNLSEVKAVTLAKYIPNLFSWVNSQGMSHSFYEGLKKICTSNLDWVKSFYSALKSSNNLQCFDILDRVLAIALPFDKKWVTTEIFDLLDSPDTSKLNKGISTVGYSNLDIKGLKNFVKKGESRFNEISKNEISDETASNLLFAYRAHRKHFSSADTFIRSKLNSENESIQFQLIQLVCYAIDIEKDTKLFAEVLSSLANVHYNILGEHNQLSYHLERKLETHYSIVIQYLKAWIEYSPENARQIVLFQGIFNELYSAHPQKFSKLLTRWLNQDSINYHIALSFILRDLGYRGVATITLDKALLKTYSFYDIEFIVKKFVGFEYDKDRLNSILYSILESTYTNQDSLNLVAHYMVTYLIFNYYSTIEFLEEKKKKAPSKLKKILTEIIQQGRSYYDAYTDLDILKEFQPSEERLNYIHKLQSKKLRKDQDEYQKSRKGLLSLFTNLHFRSGKTAFGKFDGQYSAQMEPKLISHSAEMPRGEFIDPVKQKLIRLDGRLFIRRK